MNVLTRDLGDVLDRASISKLKAERIGAKESIEEWEAFKIALEEIKKKYPQYDIDAFFNFMVKVNSNIWSCEAGLKGGKEELLDPYYILSQKNKMPLSNIGAMTIVIRDFNALRVTFKNIINSLVGDGIQDIKDNHLSEESK